MGPRSLGASLVATAGLGLAVALALAVGTACGTDATGVQSCRQIEEARCAQAPACEVSITPPYHTTGSDVDACVRFYDDACLHGLSVSDPGAIAVSACVAAIHNDGCGVVLHPESDPACAWLVPPGTASDAATGDGGTDADADADAASDADVSGGP